MLIKSQKVVVAFSAWAILTLTLLTLFNSLNYEYLFVLDLLGLLVITQLLSPYTMKPKWRPRLDIFLMAGVAIFALLVSNKALQMIS
ncbi:hypothetical protein Mtc_0539 [Methanocella conradii HZ254]|uniref:Uncharacterized protein n=1 Tax=Methanocella conradii (strain DSM 24694 / JCM 17849 / CGMCC 1.5162 / HZ254) TaxID=1041930 RepID=H8I5I5_METCZ|nr:hypothetical protein [Methanocella conradii]AFC99304.1 hypothetical protein Mtc_0539 [Methanocella conradii HZ254]MDI6896916.1 hypothetical protein [Methanocella conradii]